MALIEIKCLGGRREGDCESNGSTSSDLHYSCDPYYVLRVRKTKPHTWRT